MKLTSLIIAILFAAVTFTSAQITTESNVTFQQFLQQFPAQTLPYTVSTEDLQGQLENAAPKAKRLDWEFYQFLPTLERSAQATGMMVYPEPVARFETQDHYAVLYNLVRGLSKSGKCYEIAVFDRQGNFIATRVVAGVNVKSLTAATIEANLSAVVTAYGVNWTNSHIEGLTLRQTETLDLTVARNEAQWNNGEVSQSLIAPNATASVAK